MRARFAHDLAANHPVLGPALFVTAAQYFVVQVVVAGRFSGRYSLSRNTISDLGNTRCGTFNDRYVCSPAHTLMNLSFIVLGVSIVAGTALLIPVLSGSRWTRVGLRLFAAGGLGTVIVGLFPENTVPAFHGIGAALPFLLGNAGILLAGLTLEESRLVAWYTVGTGVVALAALAFYASGHFLGLGEGGVERVVAYPQTIWQVVVAFTLLRRASSLRRARPGAADPVAARR